MSILLTVIEKPIIDTDNDGITDEKEIELGLNSNSNDSDGDGYTDGEEIGDINNPRNTDGTDEIDALDTDSDNDGVSDKVEREQSTDYRDDADKPQTISIIVPKTELKLGISGRDYNLSFEIGDLQNGELNVTLFNADGDVVEATKQWEDELYVDGDTFVVTLKALKEGEDLVRIKVMDSLGNSETQDITIDAVAIADFFKSRSAGRMNLEDANTSCHENSGRLPTINELRDAYHHIDNYFVLEDATPIWSSTENPSMAGNYYKVYGNETWAWSNDSKLDSNYVHCVKRETEPPVNPIKEKLLLKQGFNLVRLEGTIEELIASIGVEKLLIIQGAGQGAVYKKSYADQGKEFLNSFEAFEGLKGQGRYILKKMI